MSDISQVVSTPTRLDPVGAAPARRPLKRRFARVVQSLPVRSRTFGPPSRAVDWPDYPGLPGALWREVIASAPAHRPAPAYANFDPQLPMSRLGDPQAPSPSAGVLELRRARIVTSAGWIVTEDDSFLGQHSWYGVDAGSCPIFERLQIQPRVVWPGVTLSLASEWADVNYSHMMLDAVSRVHLFLKAGYTWSDVDRIVVPDLGTPGGEALIDLAGIPREKITPQSSLSICECERLIAPSFPGRRRDMAGWVASFWRERRGAAASAPSKRLYVTRRGSSRTVVNEDEVIAVLSTYGFEVLGPSISPKSEMFRDAQMVVGPHGAAMSDAVFMAPGGALVELVPSEHLFPYFPTLSAGAGLRYAGVLSQSEVGKPGMQADITVPIDALKAALRALGA